MKKIFFSILLFSSLQPAIASAGNNILNLPETTLSTKDTVPFALDEEEMMDYNDSLISFPAYDLYCGWDTVNIHSIKFDVASLKDSTKNILLFDEKSCGYVHPFEGKITSTFGPRKKRYHYGVDIDLETGDCVAAAFDGKVRIAKKSKSYGNVIVIRHASGLETYYAHLSKINVEIGQEVFAGQVIGLGGNTGRSRGSHLHFEVRYMGQPINPAELISFDQHKLLSDTLALSSKTFNYLAAAKKAAVKNYASSKANSKGRVHVVKQGDTLSAIARKYGTTTKALCQKNGLKPSSKLRLGQKLKT
jgi:murein DD-endopeptidase MepM/ murein hydrolase activator NlpD